MAKAQTTTAQDYLKELYQLQQRSTERAPIAMGRLAEAVGVTPGTATTMVKRFADDGLMRYTPRKGARLTTKGEKVALGVLRRHRIVETFLVEHLGLDWSEVHAEAEVLEHAISEKVLDRLDDLLGHPTADPHGSPIPPANGKMRRITMRPLSRCKAGQRVTVGRLLNTASGFLKLAETLGLVPNAKVRVIEVNEDADAVTLQVGRRKPTTLGLAAADSVMVAMS
ncbi:MAG: metal-dependent transcriptional regulator [Planctomycetota bacterium]